MPLGKSSMEIVIASLSPLHIPSKRRNRLFCTLAVLLLVVLFYQEHAAAQEFNTALMNSTFEIVGNGIKPGTQSEGTVFILGKPMNNLPNAPAYFVMVTAAHVLNGLSGDTAELLLRQKLNIGSYRPFWFPVQIRRNGKNLYVQSPVADVAVMYINLPGGEMTGNLVSTLLLAKDSQLKAIELHPGDQLSCLGFPLRIDFDGFPVIRTGLVASYPLTPSRTVKQFYYTFHVFPGNSGGPVYFDYLNRGTSKGVFLGARDVGIVGLVSQQAHSNLPDYAGADLDIAIIVPSSFIIDTIAMLPPTPSN